MNIFAWTIFMLLLLLLLSCIDGSSQQSYKKKASNKHVGKDFILGKLMLLSRLEDGHSFNKSFKGKQLMKIFSLKADKKGFKGELNETFRKEDFFYWELIKTYDGDCNWWKFIKTVEDMCKNVEKFHLGCFRHQNLCVKNVQNFEKYIKFIKNTNFLCAKMLVIVCNKNNCICLKSLKELRDLMNYSNDCDNETILSLLYFADNKKIDSVSNKCVKLLTLNKTEDLIRFDTPILNYLFNNIKNYVQLFKKRKDILLRNEQNIDSVLTLHSNKHQSKNWFSNSNFQESNFNANNSFILFHYLPKCKIYLTFNCSSVPRTFQNESFVLLCSSKELSKIGFHKRKSQKTHPFTSRSNSRVSPVIIPLSKYISSAFTAKVKKEIGPYKIMKEFCGTKINKGIPNGKLEIIKNDNKSRRSFSEYKKRGKKYFSPKGKKQIDLKNGTAFREPLFKGRKNKKNRKEKKWPVKNNARGKRAANFIPKEDSLAYLDPFYPSENKNELFDEENEKLETKQSEIETLRLNSLEPSRKTHLRHLRSKRRKGEKKETFCFNISSFFFFLIQ